MGRCVIKAAREADLYLEWSSVVDACTRVGTRAEFRAGGHSQEALERADRTGTSDRVARLGHWDDEPLGVGTTEHRRQEGVLLLARTDLAAFARFLSAGDSQAAEALLKPDPEPRSET